MSRNRFPSPASLRTSFTLALLLGLLAASANAGLSLLATVPVGNSPVALAVTPDGRHVWVANTNSFSLSVIDTSTNTVEETITLAASAAAVALTPDGTEAWVTNRSEGSLTVVDTTTRLAVATIAVGGLPDAVSFAPDSSLAYVTNDTTFAVAVVDVATRQVVNSIATGTDTPETLVIAPDGKTGYLVVSPVSGPAQTRVLDLDTKLFTGSIPELVVAAVTGDGRSAWAIGASLALANTVNLVDLPTRTILASVPVQAPYTVAMTPDESLVLAPQRWLNSVVAINTFTKTVTGTVTVGEQPHGLVTSPDGFTAFSADNASNTVSVVGIDTLPRIGIDVKPGSFPNTIKLSSQGTVPVAILSSPVFDAATVEAGTLTFAGAPVKLRANRTPMAALSDVNGDGRLDLVAHFPADALQLLLSDTYGTLLGKLVDETPIRGVDSVRVIP